MGRRATPDEVLVAEHFLGELFSEANVGLCILDEQLRFLAVNRRLALIYGNGVSAESHVGKTVREILGGVAPQAEQACKQVIATGEPLLNVQFKGELATDTGMRQWAANLFPVRDANGRVTRVCVVVTRTPANTPRELQQSLAEPPNAVLRSWKEIAQYIGACVKTLQRWERLYGFPARRLKESKGSVVFALRQEIDGWMQTKARTRPSQTNSHNHSHTP